MNAFFKRNASTILTTVGGLGVIATAITVAKATPKALELLEEAREEKGEDLTRIEKNQNSGSKIRSFYINRYWNPRLYLRSNVGASDIL